MQPSQGWGTSDFCWDSLPPTTKSAGLLGAKAGYGSGAAALSARLHQSQRVDSGAFTFQEQEAILQPPSRGGLPGLPPTELAAALAGKWQAAGALTLHNEHQQRLGLKAPAGAPPALRQRTDRTLDRQAGNAVQVAHTGGTRAGGPAADNNRIAAAPTAVAGAAAEGAVGGTATSAAPVKTDLTLEKYLEFHTHLTKGSGSVQQLSELEKSVLKILLVSGYAAGSKSKKDILEKLSGMQLFDPSCCVPADEEAAPSSFAAAEAPAAALDMQMLEGFEWLSVDPSQEHQLLQHIGESGGASYSCCPLPSVVISFPPGTQTSWPTAPPGDPTAVPEHPPVQIPPNAKIPTQVPQESQRAGAPGYAAHAASGRHDGPREVLYSEEPGAVLITRTVELAAMPARPAAGTSAAAAAGTRAAPTRLAVPRAGGVASLVCQQAQSDTTQASGPPTGGLILGSYEEVEQRTGREQSGAATAAAVTGKGDDAQAAADDDADSEEEGKEEPGLPSWLAEGVQAIAERSQGSSEQLSQQQLVGRKVSFIIAEDLQDQDGDVVNAGVHDGQVVEYLGSVGPAAAPHTAACPDGCWYFVRLQTSRSDEATRARPGRLTKPSKQAGRRRVDIQVELAPDCRVEELEQLLTLTLAEVQGGRGRGKGRALLSAPVPDKPPAQLYIKAAAEGRTSGTDSSLKQQPQRKRGAAVPTTRQPPSKLPKKGPPQLPSLDAVGNCGEHSDEDDREGAPPLGTLGDSASVQVEVFGCDLAMSLDSSKISSFAEGKDGRLAKLQAASNMGRKAVERALKEEAG
ncbi:hypothetical protein N2152v2_010087 [Parachlorella kessleri]